jgi:DNA invertase Pin-like site-specific DNA recombinase
MDVAIYSRVSTDDKGQDPLNQLLQLRAFAEKQSWRIVREYTDRATGKNGDRTQFQAMMRDAGRRKFDVLLFWSLDRLTREGTFKTLCYLRQLSASGVGFKSYTEQFIDSLGPFAEAVIGILGAVAQMERTRISDRTKAGMARVRATGKHVGRPRKLCDVARLRRLRDQGMTYAAIAKQLKLSRAMVWKRLNLSSSDLHVDCGRMAPQSPSFLECDRT